MIQNETAFIPSITTLLSHSIDLLVEALRKLANNFILSVARF